jgi:hypothetical protein
MPAESPGAWTVDRVPDANCTNGDLDLAAPSRMLQFVSYVAVTDSCFGKEFVLRVARVDRPA